MVLALLGLVIYIVILLSPLVLIDIIGGWTFSIYPLYILTYQLFEKVSQDDWVESHGEPADGREGRWGIRNTFNLTSMALQGISALIFFIIFAFNDGAGAFSTFIIGSIILSIVIKFKQYFKPIVDSYKKLIVWIFGFYKKYLRGY